MLFQKTISLIIPCKNEEQALASLLPKAPLFIDEIIVVDNASTDQTSQVAHSLGAAVYTEKRHIGGIGYGFAHQMGVEKACGDFIVAMDGDDTYPLEAIKKIIIQMEKEKIDFVSCSRLPLADGKSIAPLRRLGIQVLNLLIFLLYGYYFTDILSGMWVLRREVKSKLRFLSGGWDFSPEVKLAALLHREVKFVEMRIPYFERKGESKLDIWRTGFGHCWFILKYRFCNFTNPLSFSVKLIRLLQTILT